MDEGFILLYRKFLSWEWYQDNNTKIVFIHCLIKANFKAKEWRGITIKRGQFFTSINHLSNELNMSIKEIRTALKKLKKTNEIVQKGASNGTMITICKYDDYQKEMKPKGKPRANEGQAKGKRRATTNNDNNEEQLNNVNNKEGIIFPFNSENFINIWNLWKEYKKEQHNFTYKSQLSEQAALKKLSNLSENEQEACEIIENSIAQGYKGLFKLKNKNNGNKPATSDIELANILSKHFD